MQIFKKTFLLSVIFAMGFVRPAQAQAETQATLPDLFVPSIQQARSAEPTTPEVVRWRSVEVDFSVLEAAAGTGLPSQGLQPSFRFNLFEDAVYQATIDSTQQMANGSLGMTGSIDSPEVNEFVLVSRQGVLQAYVQDGARYFEIRYTGSGQLVVEVDPQRYPVPLEPQVLTPELQLAAPVEGRAADQPQADPAGQVDVLAVYTPAARAAVGGTAAIEARIQASILSANQGYTASAVSQQVRLVGMEEVNYNETVAGVTSSIETWNYALYRLTFGYYGSDPINANYLADARAFRESYGADLVFMVTALPNDYCGLGWLAGKASQDYIGYSIVHYNCTGTTAFSVQHEMGHNMGACHDRANTTSGTMPYCYDPGYSFGYQQPNQFYSVMAYSSGCGACIRLNRWSNPNLSYNGYPTGIPLGQPDAAFNSLTLNNTTAAVANYRQSVNPISASFTSPTPGGQSMIPRTFLEVSASSAVGSIVRVTYSAYYDGGWHTVANDTNGSDGWAFLWPTYDLSEQLIDLEAEIEDSLGNLQTIQLLDIPLSRSHTIAGIYTSREGEAESAGQQALTETGQLPLEERTEPMETAPAQSTVIRHYSFSAHKKFLLY